MHGHAVDMHFDVEVRPSAYAAGTHQCDDLASRNSRTGLDAGSELAGVGVQRLNRVAVKYADAKPEASHASCLDNHTTSNGVYRSAHRGGQVQTKVHEQSVISGVLSGAKFITNARSIDQRRSHKRTVHALVCGVIVVAEP